MEPEWLGEHVSVLAEDRYRWTRPRGARRGLSGAPRDFRADYQTFAGKVSAYELSAPLHLLAYQWL